MISVNALEPQLDAKIFMATSSSVQKATCAGQDVESYTELRQLRFKEPGALIA